MSANAIVLDGSIKTVKSSSTHPFVPLVVTMI